MLRRLYDRIFACADSPSAPAFLALIAFAESSVFPVPPDVLLVPMVIRRPDRTWRYAAICTAASVAGGLVGYGIGALLFDAVARPVLAAYHYEDAFARMRATYAAWGVRLILAKGLTPIPFKVVTIASGAFHFDLATFVLACVFTRGTRFFLVAALLRRFGTPIRGFIERRLTLVTAITALSVAAGFVVLRVF